MALSETLSTILIDCPELLVDFDEADWNTRKEWFDWNFTTRSLREFLITQPQVLFLPLEDIADKFNYVMFEMGLDQKQMMECQLFSHSLFHITCRHEFLKRCGFYKFPDPRKRVVNLNPHLEKILDMNDLSFVGLVPGVHLRDYRVFKDMMRKEIEEADELEEDDFEMEIEEPVPIDPRVRNKGTYPARGLFRDWTGKKKRFY